MSNVITEIVIDGVRTAKYPDGSEFFQQPIPDGVSLLDFNKEWLKGLAHKKKSIMQSCMKVVEWNGYRFKVDDKTKTALQNKVSVGVYVDGKKFEFDCGGSFALMDSSDAMQVLIKLEEATQKPRTALSKVMSQIESLETMGQVKKFDLEESWEVACGS